MGVDPDTAEWICWIDDPRQGVRRGIMKGRQVRFTEFVRAGPIDYSIWDSLKEFDEKPLLRRAVRDSLNGIPSMALLTATNRMKIPPEAVAPAEDSDNPALTTEVRGEEDAPAKIDLSRAEWKAARAHEVKRWVQFGVFRRASASDCAAHKQFYPGMGWARQGFVDKIKKTVVGDAAKEKSRGYIDGSRWKVKTKTGLRGLSNSTPSANLKSSPTASALSTGKVGQDD